VTDVFRSDATDTLIGDVVHGTPRMGKGEDAVLPFVLFAAASEKSALAVATVAAYVGGTSGASR
jgi:hypothetical protein